MHTFSGQQGEWTYDDASPLGTPGGFGSALAASGQGGIDAAVKRVRLGGLLFARGVKGGESEGGPVAKPTVSLTFLRTASRVMSSR